MLARGIEVSHGAIRFWTLRFGTEYARRLRRTRGAYSKIWHLDELCLVILGDRGDGQHEVKLLLVSRLSLTISGYGSRAVGRMLLGATAKIHWYHILQRGPSMELVGVVLESIRCDSEVEPLEGCVAIRARDRVHGLIIRIEPTHRTGSSRTHDRPVRALFGHSD